MADSMRDIKRRIKSVSSTRQITHAMELVAGAKMRQARIKADARRAYTDYLIDTMHLIAGALKHEERNEFLMPGKGDRDLYSVVTSDKGLAGGFNSNLLKFASEEMAKSGKTAVLPVGSKGLDYFRRRNAEVLGFYVGSSDEADISLASEIGAEVTELFLKGEIEDVFIIYNRFESMISQKPTIVHLLPLTEEELKTKVDEIGRPIEEEVHEETPGCFGDVNVNSMLFEPSASYMISKLIPYYVDNAIYGALLESAAGELASRRMAMENATDNANEILNDLNLRYNRARQGAITQEITEIISGAEAAK